MMNSPTAQCSDSCLFILGPDITKSHAIGINKYLKKQHRFCVVQRQLCFSFGSYTDIHNIIDGPHFINML